MASTAWWRENAGQNGLAGETLELTAGEIVDTVAPYELVSKMRASFWVIGPLLARMGEARVSLPGGCAIGTRPVDLFISALRDLGAEIDIDGGDVLARAPKGLRGGRVVFPKVTVGATHVALMAASLARGETVIENAAREPEIVDLAECLIKMGAQIYGAGTSTIRIEGVDRLTGARHPVMPDRIETGTYAMAVAMTGGDVVLEGATPAILSRPIEVLTEVGAEITATNHGLRVRRNGSGLNPIDVTTEPFPGFPTDLQAQLMALVCRASGASRIRETIFENRFMHVQELARLGADIHLDGAGGDGQRRRAAEGRAGDGDRPPRLGVARHCRPCGRGRDHRQPRLPPRPRLRADRGQAQRLRRHHRAHYGVRRSVISAASRSLRACRRRDRASR